MDKTTIKSLMTKYGYSEEMAIEALEFASEMVWEYAEQVEREEPQATKTIKALKDGYYHIQEITDFV